jgi:hypothetical protein
VQYVIVQWYSGNSRKISGVESTNGNAALIGIDDCSIKGVD